MPNQIRSMLVQYVGNSGQLPAAHRAVLQGVAQFVPQGHATRYLNTCPDGIVCAGMSLPRIPVDGDIPAFRYEPNALASLAADMSMGAPVGAIELLVVTVATTDRHGELAGWLHDALCRQLEGAVFAVTGCVVVLSQNVAGDDLQSSVTGTLAGIKAHPATSFAFFRRFARIVYLPWEANYVAESEQALAKLTKVLGCSADALNEISMKLSPGRAHGSHVYLQHLEVPERKIRAIIKNGCIVGGAIAWINGDSGAAFPSMDPVKQRLFQQIDAAIDRCAPGLMPLLGYMPKDERARELSEMFVENPVPGYVERCRAAAEDRLNQALGRIAQEMFRGIIRLAVDSGHSLNRLNSRLTEAHLSGMFAYEHPAPPETLPPKLKMGILQRGKKTIALRHRLLAEALSRSAPEAYYRALARMAQEQLIPKAIAHCVEMLQAFAISLPIALDRLRDPDADMQVNYPKYGMEEAYSKAWAAGHSVVNEQAMREAVYKAVQTGASVEAMAEGAARGIKGTFDNVLLNLTAKHVARTFPQELRNRCQLLTGRAIDGGFLHTLFDQKPNPGVYMPAFDGGDAQRQLFILASDLTGLSDISSVFPAGEFSLEQDLAEAVPLLMTVTTQEVI